jgi:hypothetical protein
MDIVYLAALAALFGSPWHSSRAARDLTGERA